LTEKDDIVNRWKEYFSSILTGNIIEAEQPIYYTVNNYIEEPTLEEVQKVIKCLKNCKAPGSDGISAELLKTGGVKLWERIYNLMLLIWKEEKIPEEWTLGVIQPIHKKGNKWSVPIIEELRF
jgi:hypothetical protein